MFAKFAHFLNEYANLLLVIVTIIYVWLTWHTLKAVQESSLREREALHLEEIKQSVIRPIVSWIALTVFGRFTGGSPELLRLSGGYGDIPRRLSHTVDDPFRARHHLNAPRDPAVPDPVASWDSTESGRISEFLYGHSRQAHFKLELRQFDGLLEEVKQLTGAITTLANECAEDFLPCEIPQAHCSTDENSMPEWVNPHLLAAACVESLLLAKRRAKTELRDIQGAHLLTTSRNEPIAKAAEVDKLEHLAELAFEKVRRKWESRGITDKVKKLLKNGDAVRRSVNGLNFTHSLGVDCELVGGRRRSTLAHLLRRG